MAWPNALLAVVSAAVSRRISRLAQARDLLELEGLQVTAGDAPCNQLAVAALGHPPRMVRIARLHPDDATHRLRIAEATGVDEAWLFAGDAKVPPVKGVTLVNAGRGDGEYTKADHEFYRAFVETKLWDNESFEATLKKAEEEGKQAEVAEIMQTKVDLMARQQWFVENADKILVTELQLILAETKLTDNLRLARWKIRRFLDDLAKEFSIKIPKLKTSTGVNEFANFPPAPDQNAPETAGSQTLVKNSKTN